MPRIIDVSKVSFAYDTQPVLTEVSFHVDKGEFLGLIGPNGGGKTTMIKILLGLEENYSGSVKIFDEIPSKTNSWRKRVGVVPQAHSFPARFPVLARDVVEMGTRTRGGDELSKADRKARIEQALSEVGAEEYANRPLYQLSGGQKQRILVARALAGRPELLLLDEPTVGVDSHGQDLLLDWIKKWRNQSQLTVVLVTHDIGVIAPLADKLACLNTKLFFHDRPDKLTGETLEAAYGCPAEMIFHSHDFPHRVVGGHQHK